MIIIKIRTMPYYRAIFKSSLDRSGTLPISRGFLHMKVLKESLNRTLLILTLPQGLPIQVLTARWVPYNLLVYILETAHSRELYYLELETVLYCHSEDMWAPDILRVIFPAMITGPLVDDLLPIYRWIYK